MTLPESDVPWLLSRACAGDWTYQPEWVSLLAHPAIRNRFEKRVKLFVVPDLNDRSVVVGVEVIRRVAREDLENREVKHFEVVQIRRHGCRSVPHTRCEGKGCEVCDHLGVMFRVDPFSHVDLLGWVAVCRVA